ncbi:MAG: FeS assembly protein [Verrucomicrobiales bacterium]|nr:FeS assembly protein [Verrucomicrobiales bacterium]
MSDSDNTEQKINEAIANPKNMGEMADADSVGTVGSPECGDMVRMWLKFKETDEGKKVIDRASFQSFGCQTAIAVASVATELLAGKTVEEAQQLEATDLSADLGPLPPMKIHCGQMVEGALREALVSESSETSGAEIDSAEERNDTLLDSFAAAPASNLKKGNLKVVKLDE